MSEGVEILRSSPSVKRLKSGSVRAQRREGMGRCATGCAAGRTGGPATGFVETTPIAEAPDLEGAAGSSSSPATAKTIPSEGGQTGAAAGRRFSGGAPGGTAYRPARGSGEENRPASGRAPRRAGRSPRTISSNAAKELDHGSETVGMQSGPRLG